MSADHATAIQNHRVDLLYVGGALAGVIEMIPNKDHPLIENVAICPVHQGKGLGRMLLDHAEKVAAALGHRKIKLYANKLFAQNMRLYERLGYETDREETRADGTTVHMHKADGAGDPQLFPGRDNGA